MDRTRLSPRDWSDWNAAKADEIRSLDLNQGLEQLRSVYETVFSSMEETRELFRPQHEQALEEMQERLQKLAQWQREQSAQSVSKHR